MREAKSYRDPYNDIKRTPVMSGPWRRPSHSLLRPLGALFLGATIAISILILIGAFHG